ncbi:hypothetical protein [Pandoraea captiosa]|nr:hypothetical protein [Pandoraea captiosa]
MFLISAAVAVAVVSLLISFWGLNYSRQLRVEKAERVGEALKVMGDRVQSFVVEHHDKIDAVLRDSTKTFDVQGLRFGAATDGGGKPYLTNLSASTLIKATRATGIGERPPGNVGNYVIRVYHECGGSPSLCNVETLTYIDKPMPRRYSTDPDMDAAAIAARRIGVLGGVSTTDSGHPFRFIDATGSAATVPNPDSIAGLVAVRGGYATSAMDVYVRRDGSLGMTGPLNFKQTDGRGETRHNIVGVGTLDASNVGADSVVASGVTVNGELKANSVVADNGLKAGDATITGKLELRSDLVGARDIEGTGELRMPKIDIASKAKVGQLDVTGSTRLRGTLDMNEKDIENAGRVKGKTLTAEEGIVELKEGTVRGRTCDVWGVARDSDGRLLSCQREKPGSNNWIWKLASTPGSVKEVPVEIVKEIVREIKIGEQWKVSTFSLLPTPSGASHGSALYFYVASHRDAKVLACTITNTRSSGAEMRAANRQGDYIVTQSADGSEELMCLSKGSGSPTVTENAWYWWGWPTFDEHGGYRRPTAKSGWDDIWYQNDTDDNTMPDIHHAVRNPIRVTDDTQARFNNELQRLFLTFGMTRHGPNLNHSVLMATFSGSRNTMGMAWGIAYRPKSLISCKFTSNIFRASIGYAADNVRWYLPGGNSTYTVQCSFSVRGDLTAHGFRICLKDCPFK